MAKAIFEIRQKKVRGGLELQAISRSDRGTKYISGSVVIEIPPGGPRPTNEQVEAAIKTLTENQ